MTITMPSLVMCMDIYHTDIYVLNYKNVLFAYLWLPELGQVGTDIEADSFRSSRKCDATYEQYGEQDIWKQSCKVHNLQCKE
jgi:hypothetical protein